MEKRKGKLILDGNALYEIDSECVANKEKIFAERRANAKAGNPLGERQRKEKTVKGENDKGETQEIMLNQNC